MFHLLYEQIIAGTYFETRSARFMGAYVVVSLPSTARSTPRYKSENVRRRRLRMFGQRNRGSRDKMLGLPNREAAMPTTPGAADTPVRAPRTSSPFNRSSSRNLSIL